MPKDENPDLGEGGRELAVLTSESPLTALEKGTTDCVTVGDLIETEFEFPYRRRHRELLNTPAAAAFGNELVASGRWKKV